MTAGGRRATYREVLGVPEFRALYVAQIASLLGDQAAKVALAILVLNRSDNPMLAALAYAVGYLPWIVGGPILSPLADRRPRKQVMVWCDLARAVALGAMALGGMPLWMLFALLLGASLLMPPFEAARAATMPDVLTGDRYVVGSSLSNITNQLSQVTGFVLGGVAVVVLRPRGALLADAVSFLLSAGFIAAYVKHRPPVARDSRPTLRDDVVEGARVVFKSPVLRSILLLAWFGATFSIIPEGLAVTYARRLGYGPLATGILTAAPPFGQVVGAILVVRLLEPERRVRIMRWLAFAGFVPLLATAIRPPVWGAAALWTLSGAGMAFQIPANATFMTAVPAGARGRAFGLAQSGMQALQGLALAGGGALALVVEPHQVVAVAGLAGMVAMLLLGWSWPTAELARVGAPPDEDDIGPLGDIPIESPASALPAVTARWSGPYPLVPRPRTILAKIVPLDATRDSARR